MELSRSTIFRALGALFFVAVAVWINVPHGGSGGGNEVFSSHDGVSPITTSATAQPPRYALHVLFIGNSYTFVHDIPHQVVDIASSDPDNPTQFIVQSVTRGGIGLRELWADGNALAALRAQHWDEVVLQEQSFWAMTPGAVEQAETYFTRFDQEIKKENGKTLLYLTWPRQPGSQWYTDPKTAFLQNPDFMLQSFTYHTQRIAAKLGAQVAPVGLYWARALKAQPPIGLYEADAHHPSIAGAYLSALVFYKTLTGRDVTKITFVPAGLSAETAGQIKTIVSQSLSQQ